MKFFIIFVPWMLELFVFDLDIGFLIKNYIFCQLDMSRIPTLGQQIVKFMFLKYELFLNTKSGLRGSHVLSCFFFPLKNQESLDLLFRKLREARGMSFLQISPWWCRVMTKDPKQLTI